MCTWGRGLAKAGTWGSSSTDMNFKEKYMNFRSPFSWVVSWVWHEHQGSATCFDTPVPIRIYCNCYRRYLHTLSTYYSSSYFISKFFLHEKNNSRNEKEISKAINFCYKYIRFNGFLSAEFTYYKSSQLCA